MAQKKVAIMDAALRLFAQKGIKATTTREISSRARVAEGSIYRHFKNKEDLALRLFVANMEQFARFLLDKVKPNGEPEEKLGAAIRAFFAFARNHPVAYSYVISRHHSELKRVGPGRFKPKDVFVEIMQEGIEAGRFRRLEVNLAAAMVIGMIIRTIFFLEQGLVRVPRKKALEEVERSALRILTP